MTPSLVPRTARRDRQRGGFVLGLVVGLVVGIALALGVALYVTKVPVPFINKVPQRTPEQDAAEAERLRKWDPNAPLQGRAATPPVPGITPPTTGPAAAAPASPDLPPVPGGAQRRNGRDPAAILAGQDPAAPRTSPAPAAPTAVAPAAPEAAGLEYYVQAGAFSRADDAERQRASLAMLGYGAKVSEREQAGRTIYRVRLGPFTRRAEADSARESLDGNGIQAAVVHVQKSMN